MENSPQNTELSDFIDGCSVLVVIVTYNSGRLVIDALHSLTQELSASSELRVLVVDNTCGDDAGIIEPEIVKNEWSNWVKISVSARNGGFSYGNNLAIKPALKANNPPKYIWLLNPDTRVRAGACSELLNFLDNKPNVGIAGSCLINHDGNEWRYAFRFPTIISEMEQALQFGPFSKLVAKHIVAQKMDSKSTMVDWLPGASMMIKTEVFSSTGLFDEDYFLYYEETDFCLNSASHGWQCWYVPSSKVLHIAGQSTGATGEAANINRLPQYMFDSRCRYFTKNHGYIYAMLSDLARIFGLVINKILRFVRQKPNEHNPYLLRDSLRNFNLIRTLKSTIKKS